MKIRIVSPESVPIHLNALRKLRKNLFCIHLLLSLISSDRDLHGKSNLYNTNTN